MDYLQKIVPEKPKVEHKVILTDDEMAVIHKIAGRFGSSTYKTNKQFDLTTEESNIVAHLFHVIGSAR